MNYTILLALTIATISVIDAEKAQKRIFINDDNAIKKVKFLSYTRNSQDKPLALVPGQADKALKERINLPIKIIAHGYLENSKSWTTKDLAIKMLQKMNAHVIAVDWGAGAIFPIYWPAAKNVQAVGRYLGKLVDFLVAEGANPSNIHMIGFSLGAQIVGFAGAAVKQKVRRITGLDPAQPGFDKVGPEARLDPTDAHFVDVIHTSGGLYSLLDPLGHVDFYVNGGRHQQPGCPIIDLGVCSHQRAVAYYIESLDPKHKFPAYSCPRIPLKGLAGCAWSPVNMGYYLTPDVRGIYYVHTNEKPPYAPLIEK